ncbi:hypothetical protein Nepgr_013271 [Nepenthes gracilis]|uniref:C2H2-type domain-containing protein n=1 Tax=Nepenthes gracilis TaxID=150966 RepID=A0AAD3XP80_NEPGR|nr:hypothetical protein Nepgr_013271 [Nepenthes gracilis]
MLRFFNIFRQVWLLYLIIVADPDAEVIALSPKALMATNRFVCEICNQGFQHDQNPQRHQWGHNLLWKLKQRSGEEVKKRVYVCLETTCVHHNPSRALGDLTGIKKPFCRKHGKKKWKCKVFKEFVHGICRNLCTSIGSDYSY